MLDDLVIPPRQSKRVLGKERAGLTSKACEEGFCLAKVDSTPSQPFAWQESQK